MTTSPDTASLKPARCVPSPPGWSAILPPSGHTGDPGPRRGAGGTQLLWYNTAGKVSWRQPPGVLSPPPPLRRVSPFVQPGPFTNNLVRTIEDIEHLAQQRSIVRTSHHTQQLLRSVLQVDIRPGNCRISLRMGRDYREGLPIPPKHQRITGRRAPQRPPRLTTNRRGQGAQTASPYLRSPASPCSQYTGRTIGPVGFQVSEPHSTQAAEIDDCLVDRGNSTRCLQLWPGTILRAPFCSVMMHKSLCCKSNAIKLG